MRHHRHHRHDLILLLLAQQALRERGQAARVRNNPTGRRLTVWQFFRESPRVRRRLLVLALVSVAPAAIVAALSGEIDPGLGVLLFLSATVLMVVVFLSVSMFWLFEALKRRGY